MRLLRVIAVPSLLLTAAPAHALDCSKAATPIEKAICASPDLLKQDSDLSKAYGVARTAVAGDQRKSLALAQKRWIETRENICGNLEGNGLSKCVADETRKRLSLLTAAPESGPGYPGKMVPVFLQQSGGGAVYDLDYALLQFVKPATKAEKRLNADVTKILAEAPRKSDDNEAPSGMMLSQMSSFSLSYASPLMISIAQDFYAFEGGAHGNGGIANINLDMKSGNILTSGGLFSPAALNDLTAECKRQIIAAKIERNKDDAEYDIAGDPNFQEKTIADGVDDFTRWSVFAGQAVVTFDSYAVGSYAEGPYECEFPMAKLKSLAKNPNPLP
jgi:uncharacterized protein YecT (DUF1311 family)